MEDEQMPGRVLRAVAVVFLLAGLFLVDRRIQPVAAGFMAGTAVAMWNAYFLWQRLRHMTDEGTRRKARSMFGGLGMRFTLVAAVLAVACRLPHYLNVLAVGAGLMVVPVIAATMAIRQTFRDPSRTRV